MKQFFFDVETTGLDPDKHEIVEIAIEIRENHKTVDSLDFRLIAEHPEDADPIALKTHGLDITKGESQSTVYYALQNVLSSYIKRYEPFDKFYVYGYNVAFDVKFLRALWLKNGDKYFGSFFHRRLRCVMEFCAHAIDFGSLENFKLATVCKSFGVDLSNAHDARADLDATIALYYRARQAIADQVGVFA